MNYFITFLLIFPFLAIVFAIIFSHLYTLRRLRKIKKKTFKPSLGYHFSNKVENYFIKTGEDLKFIIKHSKEQFLDEFKMSDDPEERYQKSVNRKRYEIEKEKAYWEKKSNEWFK